MPNKKTRLDIALLHGKRGWRVFPLHTPNADGTCSCGQNTAVGEKHSVGKHPRIASWQTAAATDAKTIHAWWKKWPDANIGIATGATSGLIVLDVDGPEGEAVLERFGVPKTPTVITGKGRQLYFKYPGYRTKNKVRVYPDLDGRGDGGYVCAPGCLHASGRTYYFEEGLNPDDVPLAGAPQWWLDIVRDTGMAESAAQPLTRGPIKAGRRNSVLASLAGSLRDKGLKVPRIMDALLDHNKDHCQPPLDANEVRQIAESYGRYPEGDPCHGLKLYELARRIMGQDHFICSPIDMEGKGVVLMVYRDGSYKPHGASVARSMALRGLGNSARPETINSTVELIKEATKKDDTLLNPKSMRYLNVSNGMLDWTTGEIAAHDAGFLSSIQLPVEWRPDAKSDVLNNFLAQVFPPDALELAEEIIGYCMVPTTVYQKAFMLCGEGANGKSTFLNLLDAFLGVDNISHVSLHSLEDNLFAASELQGKLLNIYADLAATRLEKVECFKNLVGGDPLSAQRKYGQPFILHSFARLMFSANSFPRASDTSDAFMRRWIVIPFPNRFEGKNRDPFLTGKLQHTEVLSALLVRAVTGLRRLHERGEFGTCVSVDAKLQEYKVENDSAYEFSTEILKVGDPWDRIPKKDMWASYEKWCQDNGIRYPMPPRKFNHQLQTHLKCAQGVFKIGGVATKVWEGVAWQAPPAAAQEKF